METRKDHGENAELTLKSVLRALANVRTLLRAAVVLASFELVARVGPWVVPKTVHQPFLLSARQIDAVTDGEGKRTVKWVTNERGARGRPFRGQSHEIAVLGSSTTAGTLLDQQEAWPSRLASWLPCVHVDNFARDGAIISDAARILDHFAATGARYETVIIMQHGDTGERRLSDAFQFWGQWDSSAALQGPELTVKHARLQIAREERLAVVRRWFSPSTARRRDPNDLRNWKRRQSSNFSFVRESGKLTPGEETQIATRGRELFEVAKRAADRVYFVSQPVAFDESELPAVAARWFSLYPATTVPGAYRDNASVAERIRSETAVLRAEALRNAITVIELDDFMRSMLRKRGDLFLDKWHFSRNGAAVAAQRVAEQLIADGIRCRAEDPDLPESPTPPNNRAAAQPANYRIKRSASADAR